MAVTTGFKVIQRYFTLIKKRYIWDLIHFKVIQFDNHFVKYIKIVKFRFKFVEFIKTEFFSLCIVKFNVTDVFNSIVEAILLNSIQ